MSLDNPNEYEKAIEEYAEARREHSAATQALEISVERHKVSHLRYQELWRKVAEYRLAGHIKPGIWRLNSRSRNSSDVEGIVISVAGDYPEVLPMWRK